ncbi:MAG: PocR ligand-binding domain-containing protein [Bdellovibrionales bacterium]|nr:PocR ligand-binding domain-containing protein [Oligoflexia bacterium]
MLALMSSKPMTLVSAPTLWDDAHWAIALNQFARASGLTICIYDVNKTRAVGPIVEHPLIHLIEETGAWRGGLCEKKELTMVNSVLENGQPVSTHFEESLYLQALPLRFRDKICGVLVVGWAFDQFADPIRCSRLAKSFDLPENILWKVAREVAPISRERISIFVSLLKTLANSILGQHALVDEARDANRVKDQFMATASHELKTPLTSIQLRVALLRRMKTPTTEQLMHGLDVIDRGVKTQTKLVDDLLESSRVSTGKLRLDIENFDPGELIRSAVETISPGAETKGVQVSFQSLPLRLKYKGDITRLQQVYWNLLNNAVKFTPKEGFISIDAREIGGSFVVEVKDSGRGLDSETLPRLFDAFFQVRSRSDGSNNGLGLGLSVAKAIVDLHGGTIRATSDGLGHGACFIVSIPSLSHSSNLFDA